MSDVNSSSHVLIIDQVPRFSSIVSQLIKCSKISEIGVQDSACGDVRYNRRLTLNTDGAITEHTLTNGDKGSIDVIKVKTGYFARRCLSNVSCV